MTIDSDLIFERSFKEAKEIAREHDFKRPMLGSVKVEALLDDDPDLSHLETKQDATGRIISSCRYTNEDAKKYGKKKAQA